MCVCCWTTGRLSELRILIFYFFWTAGRTIEKLRPNWSYSRALQYKYKLNSYIKTKMNDEGKDQLNFSHYWAERRTITCVFFSIGCHSRKLLFFCIMLKDSEICCFIGHAPSIGKATIFRVARNCQLFIEMNGIVSLCHCVALSVKEVLDWLCVLLMFYIMERHLYQS